MLSVTPQDYKYLRTLLLCSQQIEEDTLNILKLVHERDVNSARRLETVLTLDDLIKLLEKRACVSENDVTIFEGIGKVLQNEKFIRKLRQCCNRSASTLTEPQNRPEFAIQDQVDELITSEIGCKWVDFARALNIRESKLDELKMAYANNYSTCAQEILEHHIKTCPPRQWKQMILDALSTARRNDLRKKVENIFNSYS